MGARPHIRLPALGAAAVLVLLWAGYAAHTLGAGGDAVDGLAQLDYHVMLFLAGTVCLARVALVRRERLPWAIIGGSLVVWAAADVYYTLALEGLDSPPYPSLADAGWLVFYPASYVAIVLLVRARVRAFHGSQWLDGLLAALSASALAAALAFGPIADATTGSAAAIVTNLTYPIADLLLLGFVLGAIALTGWRPGRMWLVLGVGLVLSAVADTWYLYAVASGAYRDGMFLDSLWPASTLLIAAAAWQPDDTRADGPLRLEGWRVLVLPSIFMAIALGLLVIDHFNRLTGLAIALATAAIAVGISRMALTFGENLRMLAGSRREAMTDPLTGLGNRRQLLAGLDELLADPAAASPHLVVLFDLNGFKSYNDAFGHLAGDDLLARLGRRLHAAVSARGNAYRLGGDEFCAVLRLEGASPEVLVGDALAGLTERGEGFSVDAAWGAVEVPTEAVDGAGVLQLADRRMYAHKSGVRASAGRQTRDVLMSTLRERQPELHDHLRDVAELARAVARALGASPEEVDEVGRAAELHDVGKIAIPDAILNKAGPLAPDEVTFIRRHTLIGERILAAAPALRPVATLVRSTHERWDGGGYPDGLRGEEIPLGARIVAVCDAFHAMTSDRAYRQALADDVALRELQANSGKQFDPAVVEVFARVRREETARAMRA